MALATRMVTGAAAALTLAACSAQDSAFGAQTAQTTAGVEDADCIPIADGTYQIRNGKILVMKADASQPEAVPATVKVVPAVALPEIVGAAAKVSASTLTLPIMSPTGRTS